MKTLTFGEKIFRVLEKVTGRTYQKLEKLAVMAQDFEELTNDNIDSYHKFQREMMNALVLEAKDLEDLDAEHYSELFLACMESFTNIMIRNAEKLGESDFLAKAKENLPSKN